MTEFTDYNDYELPEPFNVNERNEWGRILNDALDQFDDDIILRGTLAERPSASEQDRLFLDRGSNTLYRDTGSNWEQFGAQLTIQDSQATIDINPSTLNFDRAISVTNPSAGTVEIDIEDVFIENSGDSMEGVLDLNSNDLEDGAQVIWDASVGEIPDSALGSIDNTTLTNDSITLTAGDGLKNAGTVALGSSITVDIEPADFAGDGVKDDGSDNIAIEPNDFAGAYLSDDGNDNLRVNIARGLESNGSSSIQVDEDTDFTFTAAIDFSAGLDTQGDITDGAQVIWDVSAQEIPDSAMGSIANSTLTNDSITVNANDGLKSGGTVALGSSVGLDIEPSDFAGTYLSDDGTDNLQVNISTGIEGDGSDAIRLDEDYAATWTSLHTFNGGLTMGGTLNASSNTISNLPEPTSDDHAARKQYVDGVAQGLNLKNSCVVASNNNIDLASATDPNPIDGYTVSDGERVLLKAQSDATENGIYVANTATDPTTWTRSTDFDDDNEVTNGSFTFVDSGTNNGSTSWIVTSADPIAVGTDVIEFSQFASAGEITAGDGLTKNGQTLNIEPANFAGTFLSDDGSDNLTVDIGRGLENDGSNNIRVDEDTDFTFTAKIDASGGIDLNGADLDNVSNIEMDGDIEGVDVDIAVREVSDIVGPANGATSLELRTQGSGNHDVTIRDGNGNQDIAIFNEGADISFPNGNLSIPTGYITVNDDLSFGTYSNSESAISYSSDSGSVIINDSNGSYVAEFTDNEEVEVPNGDITSGDTNSALELDEQASLADSGKAQLSRDAQVQGYAMIQDVTNGNSTMVYLGGSAQLVEILHDSGSGDNFSTVEGQNGTTNIYYDSTNGQYEINNETGASATYALQIMKA
jgi:hypothetical protein